MVHKSRYDRDIKASLPAQPWTGAESGGALLWAMVAVLFLGLIGARLEETLGISLRALNVGKQREVVERSLQSSFSLLSSLMTSGPGCQLGLAADCAPIRLSQYTCRPSMADTTTFAGGWWHWHDQTFGRSEAGVAFELAQAPAAIGPWRAFLSADRPHVKVYLPYIPRSLSDDEWEALMTDGVPRIGQSSEEATLQLQQACVQTLWRDLRLDAETDFAEGWEHCQNLRAKPSRFSGQKDVDPEDDTTLTRVRLDLGEPVCRDGRVAAIDVKGTVEFLPTSIFARASGALRQEAKARIPVEAHSNPATCTISGPSQVTSGTYNYTVTVSGASTGLDIQFAHQRVYLARSPDEPAAIVWSGPITFAFGATDAGDVLNATVYDAALRPSGACQFAVSHTAFAPQPPTCELNVQEDGCCLVVSMTAHGSYYAEEPPEPYKCDLVPGERYSFVGHVYGAGGTGVCQSQAVTASRCSGSGVGSLPTPGVIAALTPPSDAVSSAPRHTISVLRTVRFGTDERGRNYRVELVEESQGNSSRRFERVTYPSETEL